MSDSIWAMYFSNARRPAAVSRYWVFGIRPSKLLSTAMYFASSSLRAWTLRLPSVVSSSAFRSLKVSESLTASALTMASRIRSWMMRSRLVALGSDLGARGSGLAARDSRLAARFSFFVSRSTRAADLPAMFPRDDETEQDVKAAEAGGHEKIAVRRRSQERR